MSTIVNKVAESGIISLDLEKFFPSENEIAVFDLKDYLFMGLILKEKEFREALKNLDSSPYQGKLVALTCSADAIIPVWAYMLVASLLQPVCKSICVGNALQAIEHFLIENIKQIDSSEYADKRLVIKGCGEKEISPGAYIAITSLLRPVVKSIMYGEPCSTVPVFKKPVSSV